jgi:hypothetical protein
MNFSRPYVEWIIKTYVRIYSRIVLLESEFNILQTFTFKPLHLKHIYCNKFAGSISQWKFITLTAQYTTVEYSSQLF